MLTRCVQARDDGSGQRSCISSVYHRLPPFCFQARYRSSNFRGRQQGYHNRSPGSRDGKILAPVPSRKGECNILNNAIARSDRPSLHPTDSHMALLRPSSFSASSMTSSTSDGGTSSSFRLSRRFLFWGYTLSTLVSLKLWFRFRLDHIWESSLIWAHCTICTCQPFPSSALTASTSLLVSMVSRLLSRSSSHC